MNSTRDQDTCAFSAMAKANHSQRSVQVMWAEVTAGTMEGREIPAKPMRTSENCWNRVKSSRKAACDESTCVELSEMWHCSWGWGVGMKHSMLSLAEFSFAICLPQNGKMGLFPYSPNVLAVFFFIVSVKSYVLSAAA